MPITVQCSGCKQQYTVPDAIAGKSVKCKKCGVQFPVPSKLAANRPVLMAEPLEKSPSDAAPVTLTKGQRPEVPFAVWVGIFGGALGFAALVGVVMVVLGVWSPHPRNKPHRRPHPHLHPHLLLRSRLASLRWRDPHRRLRPNRDWIRRWARWRPP